MRNAAAKTMIAILLSFIVSAHAHASSSRPVVLELYTSQGCSSCPPADALLRGLAADAALLPLSFHVDYWDRLGWTDPYSRAENTARQRRYAQWLGRTNVFTPQLIVDGRISVNGADRAAVTRAIAAAQRKATQLDVMVRREADGSAIFSLTPATEPATLTIVHYLPDAQTHVPHGENGGRTLRHANSVTSIQSLGAWQSDARDYRVATLSGHGVALLLQRETDGHIIGAAYLPAQ